MRLEIKNASSYPDVPVAEMFQAIGVQLFHFDRRWPGARHVVDDLNDARFYLALVDELPEAPGALGYHDIDGEGRPYAKIAVNPSLMYGSDWLTGPYSVVSVVGHEALETVGNPIINIWRDTTPGEETAQEMCDAVEDTGYRHDGCDLTNFLLPSWFNPFGKPPFDFLGVLDAPFAMTAGGYMIIRSGGRESQRTGALMPTWREGAHARARQMGVSA